MLNILDESRGHLLALTISGKISEKDFDVLNPILEKTIDEHDDPCAYIEIKEIDQVTFKAILEDLSNIPNTIYLKKWQCWEMPVGRKCLLKSQEL